MPKCSDMYGSNVPAGWSDDSSGNCVYTTQDAPTPTDPFTGEIPGVKDEFWGDLFTQDRDVSEEFIKSQFDPYDPFEEQMLIAGAATDIGQLREKWELERGQLGEAFGLGRESRGMVLGGGMRDVRGQALQAMSRSGLATSGTISGIQRGQERDLMSAYDFGEREAKSIYEQTLATGKFDLGKGITDIGQGLEADVYDVQQDWEDEMQEQMRFIIEQDPGCPTGKVMMADGSCVDVDTNNQDPGCPTGQTMVAGVCVATTDPNTGAPINPSNLSVECRDIGGSVVDCGSKNCASGKCSNPESSGYMDDPLDTSNGNEFYDVPPECQDCKKCTSYEDSINPNINCCPANC